MKILNFEEKMKLEKITGEPIFSEPLIFNCYKVRLHVYLNGDQMGHGKFLFICFQLMEGHFDDCLSWPFTKQIIITLLHPKGEETFERDVTLWHWPSMMNVRIVTRNLLNIMNQLGVLNLLTMTVFVQRVSSVRTNYS